MKGDESEGPSTLFVVVGALILMGIIFALIMALYGFEINPQEYINIEQAFPSTLSTESLGSFKMTDLDYDTAHTTSTEIACAIARSIREDFRQYGYMMPRPESTGDYKIVEINKARTIVNRGAFRIKWNSETGNFWKFEDLSQSTKDDLMQTGTCKDEKAQPWNCSTPYLDEECISKALGALQVGDSWLCTLKTGTSVAIMAGGARNIFGNDKCGSAVADGKDNCKDYCPGGDQISAWRAPGGTKITEYVDDTDWDKSGDWPPKQCLADKCEPLYAWFLTYNKKEKAYAIETVRMAENIKIGDTSSSELVDKLLQDDAKFRDVEVAYAYPELRTRYDVTFKLTDTTTLNGMLSKMLAKLGSGWNVKFVDCAGTDCFETAPERVTWRAVSDYDQSQSASKVIQSVRKLNVKAGSMTGDTLDPDKNLDTTHTYRLVMRWWKSTYGVGDKKGAVCTNTMCVCTTCKEGDDLRSRCTWDCPNLNNRYGKVEDITRYQDYTISLVDLGEEGTTVS